LRPVTRDQAHRLEVETTACGNIVRAKCSLARTYSKRAWLLTPRDGTTIIPGAMAPHRILHRARRKAAPTAVLAQASAWTSQCCTLIARFRPRSTTSATPPEESEIEILHQSDGGHITMPMALSPLQAPACVPEEGQVEIMQHLDGGRAIQSVTVRPPHEIPPSYDWKPSVIY
jgi:hypothetical protein